LISVVGARLKKGNQMKLKQAVAVLSVLVGISTGGQAQTTFMTNGLVAYYPFNGNANDESGQKNHGTVSGAVLTTDRFGNDGQAYIFTNGVSITSIRNVGISGNQERTLSAWVKADYHPWPKGLFLGWNPAGHACYLMFPEDISYGEVRAFRFQMDGGPDLSVMSEPPGEAVQGTWHHVVWTYKANFGSSAFYLDGRALTNFYAPGAGSPTTTLSTGDNKLVMGPSFTGLMDEVRIYSRALSAAEVKALFDYEKSPAIQVPHRATATAQVVNGFVVGFTVTDPGYGYTNNPLPAVRIRDGSGVDATAHAVVENGQVVRVEIDNPGHGYSSNATVVIAPPPFSPTLKMEVLKVALDMSVVLGRKYQLEASTDLQTWAKVGAAFVAEDDMIRQEFDVTATGRFFRLNEVP
jgi:hypothetical protein